MRAPAVAEPPPHAADDFRWLTGHQGRQWLARAAALDGPLPARADRLRRDLTPARASLLLGQIELRRRAREKFSDAERMFFTAIGLEQASDQFVAGYKAARFGPGKRIVDLCSGIGGDLLALARRGPTAGVDRAATSVIIAAANAGVLLDAAFPVDVRAGEAAEADLAGCDAWHIDPDRRPRGRRTTHADLHDPPAPAIERMLAANSHAAIKLAPAARFPDRWSECGELEWISRARSCRQLVAWFGDLAQEPGRRRATLLGATGEPLGTLAGTAGVEVPPAPRVERYLFEPDAAVLAAKLSAALAARHKLAAIAPGIAYWTADRAIVDPLLASFEVQEVLPLDAKRAGALVRARGIGRLEIKVRGVDCDPAQLRRRLRPAGDREGTLLVARIAGRVTAILARRLA
jgi:hypothetical protein